MPDKTVAITLLTKGRLSLTIQTIAGICQHMKGVPLVWYVADGGSSKEDHVQVIRYLSTNDIRVIGNHSATFSPGENWNKAAEFAFAAGHDIYLRLENDFYMQDSLDISPYVNMLLENDTVGCVRLGLLPINLDIKTVGYNNTVVYQHILKTQPYTWSGNPCLVHRRFHAAYGWFPSGRSPGDTEVEFDHKVRNADGPDIWRPNNLGDYGPFGHIGETKS